jgi:beta-N-acetylhexosaminidase
MSDREQLQQEKKEARRKKRIRSQVAAYSVLVVLILAAAAGVAFMVHYLVSERQEAQRKEEERQVKLDELLTAEEDLVIPEPTPEVSQEPQEPEITPQQRLDQIVDAGIEVMTLEEKVAGLFIVTPEAITGVNTAIKAGEGTRDALAQYPVGGLVYFAKNIKSEDQIREMLTNTVQYARYPLFLAVDEEGGSVSRVASAGIGEKSASAEDIGATGNADNAYQAGVAIGGTLSGLGFNLDFAPVADLANVENSIMEGRSYGADSGMVSGFVSSMMMGLKEQKVTACLKHFPGIGSSTEDTHDGMASTDRSAEQFWAEELAVFQTGIDSGAEMIMVSHMAAPALTGDNEPSVFSKVLVTDILRGQMYFEGVIITDALNMKAISDFYGADEAAVMAILAGCDMLLMPEDFEKAYEGVLEAVRNGYISEERINDSLRRIYRIKYADRIEE